MKVNVSLLSAMLMLTVALAAGGPAMAQYDGNLANVTWWTVEQADREAFEAGLKKHNEFHAAQGDPVPILTWEEISGPRIGQYGRGSFNHHWADFDQDPETLAADTADSNQHITPFIAGAEPTIWAFRADMSRPRTTGSGAVSRVFEFRVRPGEAFAFEQAVGKIHAALSKHGDWPSYEWYELVDGGRTPTYVVVLQRDNWAGFAPGEPSMMEAVSAEYGDGTAAIFQSLGAATEKQINSMIVFRPDLSYLPAGD